MVADIFVRLELFIENTRQFLARDPYSVIFDHGDDFPIFINEQTDTHFSALSGAEYCVRNQIGKQHLEIVIVSLNRHAFYISFDGDSAFFGHRAHMIYGHSTMVDNSTDRLSTFDSTSELMFASCSISWISTVSLRERVFQSGVYDDNFLALIGDPGIFVGFLP